MRAMVRTLPAALTLLAAAAAADGPGPVALWNGRLTLGGEASLSVAPKDHGFFNYTDYERTSLRLGRLGLSAALRLGERLSVLGEVRSENLEAPRPYALYARLRPWPERRLDLQAGIIPPAFGAFARRSYGADNPLIGYPLAYQYLTSLRSDALPATADDLLRMRGRGWRSSFPLGKPEPDRGLPLVSALRWDTGVQARIGGEPVELAAALTTGTLSSPRVRDDNGGKQLSARAAFRPLLGLVLGASAARGAYLSREATRGLPPEVKADRFLQRAWGLDLEYSRGYWLVRGEGVWSGWDVPAVRQPLVASPLRARALSLEGRYKLRPGLYAAARLDHLGFSRLGSRPVAWDAPVLRAEAGAGYHLRRNLLVKAVYQHNRRDGGRVRSFGVGAAQLLFWF